MAFIQECIPIPRHRAEENLGDILIPHLDLWQRGVPDPLDDDICVLGLDLRNQISAHLPTRAVCKRCCAVLRHASGLDQLLLSLQHTSQGVQGHGGSLVVCPALHKAFQSCLIPGAFVLSESSVIPELKPLQVSIEESRLVLILCMQPQQFLENPNGLQLRRVAIRGVRFPGDEIFHAAKNGRIGR